MTIVDFPLYGIPLTKLPTYQRAEPVGNKPTVKHQGINYPLLREMLTFIQENPQTWDQANWYANVNIHTGIKVTVPELRIETIEEVNSCGTSFCFAGHVALREGFPLPPKDNSDEWEREVEGEIWSEPVEDFAADRLGLSSAIAGVLFDGDNSMEDIEAMVIALTIDPRIDSYELAELRHADSDEKFDLLRAML